MNYNPNPRSDLMQDKIAVQNHHEIVEDPVLRKHFNIALMEMQRRAAQNTPSDNFNACAAAHLRLLGAQDFIDIFMNLVETPTTPTRVDTTNLPSNLPTRKN